MERTIVLEKPSVYKPKQPDYDGLWKRIIEDLFEEFILFFAPDLYEHIDFTKDFDALQQELHQEIIQDKAGKAISDKIFKVHLKNGQEKWILVHIEVQDKDERNFPNRMFRYFYRIYDRFDREIYAIALLTNTERPAHTNYFNYSFYGTAVHYQYNMYEFYGKDVKELEQSSNPFATAIIAGIFASQSKKNIDKRYEFKKSLIISILKKYHTDDEEMIYHLNNLIYFIDNLLQLPDEWKQKLRADITPYLGKEVVTKMRAEKQKSLPTIAELMMKSRQEGMETGIEKGIEKGMKKGIIEATRDFVTMLIRENYSNEEIIKLTGVNDEEIEKLRGSIQP